MVMVIKLLYGTQNVKESDTNILFLCIALNKENDVNTDHTEIYHAEQNTDIGRFHFMNDISL
jgi:hypothetical protein